MSSTSLSLKVPYRSSLRYNTMVHDVMSWLQIEAFIYSRLKGREICQRALLAPPARSTIIPLRAPRSALERNWARQSIQGNTVHANFVMSGSCSRNRGYVRNQDVLSNGKISDNTDLCVNIAASSNGMAKQVRWPRRPFDILRIGFRVHAASLVWIHQRFAEMRHNFLFGCTGQTV